MCTSAPECGASKLGLTCWCPRLLRQLAEAEAGDQQQHQGSQFRLLFPGLPPIQVPQRGLPEHPLHHPAVLAHESDSLAGGFGAMALGGKLAVDDLEDEEEDPGDVAAPVLSLVAAYDRLLRL